jgi:hypothetical protein
MKMKALVPKQFEKVAARDLRHVTTTVIHPDIGFLTTSPSLETIFHLRCRGRPHFFAA